IKMNTGEVYDIDASKHAVVAGPIGSFVVTAPRVLTVTNANDSGAGSLRQALLDANALAATNDTITFDPSFFSAAKTMLLTGRVMNISDDVTIQGPGQALATINGNAATRILGIPANSVTASISGLTLTNANASNSGGAVYSNGLNDSLVITNCTISN